MRSKGQFLQTKQSLSMLANFSPLVNDLVGLTRSGKSIRPIWRCVSVCVCLLCQISFRPARQVKKRRRKVGKMTDFWPITVSLQ